MNKLKIKKLVLTTLIVVLVGSIYLNFKLYYKAKTLSNIAMTHIEEEMTKLGKRLKDLKEKQEIEETLEMER